MQGGRQDCGVEHTENMQTTHHQVTLSLLGSTQYVTRTRYMHTHVDSLAMPLPQCIGAVHMSEDILACKYSEVTSKKE